MSINRDNVFTLVNESLAQEIYPLEDWEIAVGIVQICISVLLIIIVKEFWTSVGKKSTKLIRATILLMCVTALVNSISTMCATFQVGSPSFAAYFCTQLVYGQVLLYSYLLLYAKQDLLFHSGIAEILKPNRKRQRKILLVVYVIAFLFYLFFGFKALAVGIRLTVIYETETTQYIRVQSRHPLYVMVGLALGDFIMSAVCVLLFVIPVLEFVASTQRPRRNRRVGLARKVSHGTILKGTIRSNSSPTPRSLSSSLKATAHRNMKWSIVGCGSTTLYLVFAGHLVNEYNTLWNALGTVDVCIKVWSIRLMFGQPSFIQNQTCCKIGRTIFFRKSRRVIDAAVAVAPTKDGPVHTNDDGTYAFSENAMDLALRQQHIDV